MKTFYRCVLLMLVAATCPIANTLAEDYYSFMMTPETAMADAIDDPNSVESGLMDSNEDARNPKTWSSESTCGDCISAAMQPPPLVETIDYRVRTMFASHTTYQFGTAPQIPGPQYAPLSKLAWTLDSTWHGLQIGIEKPKWKAHFEWLTPMLHGNYGDMYDYDWSGPDRDPALLSVSPQHWTDAQTIEIEGSYKLIESIFVLPIEVWPVIGFRYQRFGMMAYNGLQVINDGTFPDAPPVGYRWHEETVSLNQEYYMGYVGGQLRTTLNVMDVRPVTFTIQGDWAGTSAYNVDHHISGYEAQDIHRYTMEKTHGNALHFALIAETPISEHLDIGIQADHTQIRTSGTHRWVMTGSGTEPVDMTWSNGVSVTSDQTSLTAFLRARF